MLGDFRISKGKLFNLIVNEYGLSDTYLITSATHTIDDKKEVVDIEVEEVRI